MSAKVFRYNGVPGCGKTTALLKYCGVEAGANDVPVEDLRLLTFTRAAREEAEDHLLNVYPGEEEEKVGRSVRTLHGAALVALNKSGALETYGEDSVDEIITMDKDPEVYAEFCGENLLHFDEEAEDPLTALEKGGRADLPNGNILFAYERVLRQQLVWGPEDWWRARELTGLAIQRPRGEVPGLIEAWREFKRDNLLWEHDDYVTLAVEEAAVPAARVLVIDEFQDVSPAQYALFKKWRDSGQVDRIYIAGDGDQSIYGFRGASPRYFEETPVSEDRGTRKGRESFRCSKVVVDVARGVLSGSRLLPRDEEGRAEFLPIEEGRDLVERVEREHAAALEHYNSDDDAGAVLLLARSVRQAAKVARALEKGGVPYSSLRPGRFWMWEGEMPLILRALRELQGGEMVPVEAAKALLKASTVAEDREEARDAAERGSFSGTNYGGLDSVVPVDKVRAWFPDGVIRALDLNSTRREALQAAIESGNGIKSREIRVDTIHASKGLEAPAVLLFNSYSKKMDQEFFEDPGFAEEERRVFYVGATRASEFLGVVDGFHGRTWAFPPLADGLPRARRIEA